MKILLLSAYYPPKTMGGAEISTHLLAKGLIQNGNEVKVITVGDIEERIQLDGVDIQRIKIPLKAKPLFEKKHSKKCAAILNKYTQEFKEADIIHANDFRSVLALMEWKNKQQETPHIIATIRDYAQISGSTNFINHEGELPADSYEDARQSHRIKEAGKVRRIFRWWQYRYNINYRKKAFKKLDGHIYISKAQLELTQKHQDLKEVNQTVIFNPIDDSYIEEKLQRGNDGAVLYVGRIENYKGVGMLLDAWQKITKDIPQAHLKIIGAGVDKKKYEKIIASTGMNYKVSIEPSVPWNRLRRIYDEAQIVVAPHIWYEPFGRTVIEAMSRGKIVVSANAGGPAELIKDNETGILFERKSTDSLVKALTKAMNMDDINKRNIGRNASHWVRDNLNKTNIATKYEDFYTTTIDKSTKK